jgi:hypothetical protein
MLLEITKKVSVLSRHLQLAIRNDEEFNKTREMLPPHKVSFQTPCWVHYQQGQEGRKITMLKSMGVFMPI